MALAKNAHQRLVNKRESETLQYYTELNEKEEKFVVKPNLQYLEKHDNNWVLQRHMSVPSLNTTRVMIKESINDIDEKYKNMFKITDIDNDSLLASTKEMASSQNGATIFPIRERRNKNERNVSKSEREEPSVIINCPDEQPKSEKT